MKAAKSFTFGDGEKNHVFMTGEEVPDKIIKKLGDSADTLILERAAKKNPKSLSREQLMELAGLDPNEVEVEEGDGFDEDQFREGMSELTTKRDLVEWAETTLGIEGLDPDDKRDEIEDQIIALMTGEEEDNED